MSQVSFCDDIGTSCPVVQNERVTRIINAPPSPHLAPVVVSYGQCQFVVKRFSTFVMTPMLGCRLSRGHLIKFSHLSPPNPSIHSQIGLHPLLFEDVSMVEFEGRSALLGYDK